MALRLYWVEFEGGRKSRTFSTKRGAVNHAIRSGIRSTVIEGENIFSIPADQPFARRRKIAVKNEPAEKPPAGTLDRIESAVVKFLKGLEK
jgi:hypothetical protein